MEKPDGNRTLDFSKFERRDPIQVTATNWKECLVDPAGDYPPPRPLLYCNGVGILFAGDLQGIKAKAKSGKTLAATLLIAALLAEDPARLNPMFTRPSGRCRVLHVDTEQHVNSVAAKQQAVYKLIGADPGNPIPEYAAISLREMPYNERREKTWEAINDFNPHFVLVDGIVDLTADFNDPKESKDFVSALMALASKQDCAIACVLHENKGKTDSTMRGHLGTELVNKSSEVYQVTRSNDLFTVSQSESRNAPMADWCFSVSSEGVPVLIEGGQTNTVSARYSERAEKVKNYLRENGRRRYMDLTRDLVEVLGVGERTVKNTISDLFSNGTLAKDGNGDYYLKQDDDCIFS